MSDKEIVVDKIDKKNNTKKEILSWVQSLVVSVIIVALIVTFIGRIVKVQGESMEPNFHGGDQVITTNIHGDLKYGDVVVIKRKDDKPIIKRIIATGGQTIDIDYETGDVKVDGEILDEPYINELTHNNLGAELPATVPKNHFFVMGDNRNHSGDSRSPSIGMIDERQIFGKVIFRIYPFDNFGTINKEYDFKE